MADTSRIFFVTEASNRTQLDAITRAFGKNLSAVMNEAIARYIELHEWWLCHIQEGAEEARRGEVASDYNSEAARRMVVASGKPHRVCASPLTWVALAVRCNLLPGRISTELPEFC